MNKQFGLVLLCALAYSGATIAMKQAVTANTVTIWAVIAVCFLAVTLLEIALMRNETLGVVYLMIVGMETLVVLSVAWMIGEGLTGRELIGGALVISGMLFLNA